MRQVTFAAGLVALCCWAIPVHAATLRCPADSVKVGNVCIVTYEASVWQIPPSNAALIRKVQQGKATLADLTAAGATELSGCGNAPANFPTDGNWTPVSGSNPPSPGVYAVSIPGVKPTACVSWFQANQACLLSGKRLLTNREWQGAAAGTPDPGTDNLTTDCAVNSPGPVNTGARSSCKSSWGVFDMVGNVNEWVADWVDRAGMCTNWLGGDASCFGGSGSGASNQIPGALMRGGDWNYVFSGVFMVDATLAPSEASPIVGFRCAR